MESECTYEASHKSPATIVRHRINLAVSALMLLRNKAAYFTRCHKDELGASIVGATVTLSGILARSSP